MAKRARKEEREKTEEGQERKGGKDRVLCVLQSEGQERRVERAEQNEEEESRVGEMRVYEKGRTPDLIFFLLYVA